MFGSRDLCPGWLEESELEDLAESLMFYYQEPGASREEVVDLMNEEIPMELWGVLAKDPRLVRGYVLSRAREALSQRRTNLLHHRDRYYYRPVDVMKMLRDVKDPECWESTYVPGDARWIKGNDSMEVLADVLLGMLRLPFEESVAIYQVYWLGNEPERDEDWAAIRSAVIELTRRMNGQYRQPPGALGLRR